MTDQLCARPGCGAPKAWHTRKSTTDELDAARELRLEADPHWGNSGEHLEANIYRKEGACLGRYCSCPGYLAPEPPEPARKPYVVEMTDEQRDSYRKASTGIAAWLNQHFVPFDGYLAAHTLPEPKRCVCGGEAWEHDIEDGCQHVATYWRNKHG